MELFIWQNLILYVYMFFSLISSFFKLKIVLIVFFYQLTRDYIDEMVPVIPETKQYIKGYYVF